MWTSRKKEEKFKWLNYFTNKLGSLEQKYIETNDPALLEQISVVKQELNKKLNDQVELKVEYIKQT